MGIRVKAGGNVVKRGIEKYNKDRCSSSSKVGFGRKKISIAIENIVLLQEESSGLEGRGRKARARCERNEAQQTI